MVGDVNPLSVVTPVTYQNDRNITNPATSGIIPASGGVGIYTRTSAADATYIYVIGSPLSSISAPTSTVNLYRSTDGLAFSLVGEIAADAADPNPGAAGSTDFRSQLDRSNPAVPLLRKVGARWFLMGVEAVYYTDDTQPQTGWRRCVVGVDDERVQFRGVVAGTGALLAYGGLWGGNLQTGGIFSSTDSGATWAVVQPATPSDRIPLGTNIFLESHRVVSGEMRVLTGDQSVVRCAAPYSTYTRQAAVFAGSGAPNVIAKSEITSTGVVVAGWIEAPITRQLLRPTWLLHTADGLTYTDATII
jgi:hypothetical protein